MRNIMKTMILFLVIAYTFIVAVQAQEQKQITISGKKHWLFSDFHNVDFTQEDGGWLITLISNEHKYSAQSDVDLLLNFNNAKQKLDMTGSYQILRSPLYSYKNALFGKASGFFQGRGGLVLRPGVQTLFGYNIVDHQFSINFWFYPFFVENGEILFEWEGQLKLEGRDSIPQRISAVFRANRMVWQFRNVFLAPNQQYSLYEVSSKPYIPENWYHHQLNYDENNAILEVLNDNRSEGITYTTVDGSARGARTTLLMNNPHLTNFAIGPKFFGLIDEWKVSRKNEPIELAPTLFYSPSGFAFSKVINLKSYSARINKVRINGEEPKNTKFLLYYTMNNERSYFGKPSSLNWKRYMGKNGEDDEMIGQFVQFKIELFSDSKAQTTPKLEGLEIFYEQQRLPAPPSKVVIDDNKQEGIHVKWSPSVDVQVAGYKVFVGKYSGQYLEPGYPVDIPISVNLDDEPLILSNLQVKEQYFLVIASYDTFGRIGPFSKEYSIRHIPD